MKKSIKIAIIVAIAVVLLTIIIIGSVFGAIVGKANKAINYTKEQAQVIAQTYITLELEDNNCRVVGYDRDLKYTMGDPVYIYEFEFVSKEYGGDDVSVYVNAKTGEASMFDYYYD